MAVDEDLAERMRVALAGTGAVREVRMFGGLCFMLNGNMVAGTSKRAPLPVSAKINALRQWRDPAPSPFR